LPLIDSVANNFASHVTSGLSGFITAAYDASVRLDSPRLCIDVVGQRLMPHDDLRDVELQHAVDRLREKFMAILGAETRMDVREVELVTVDIDFAPDAELVAERRARLASVPVYYGYDPVYDCTVTIQLRSGAPRVMTMRDGQRT
jgi:hypothetical protein